jgi:hypothetical protein
VVASWVPRPTPAWTSGGRPSRTPSRSKQMADSGLGHLVGSGVTLLYMEQRLSSNTWCLGRPKADHLELQSNFMNMHEYSSLIRPLSCDIVSANKYVVCFQDSKVAHIRQVPLPRASLINGPFPSRLPTLFAPRPPEQNNTHQLLTLCPVLILVKR